MYLPQEIDLNGETEVLSKAVNLQIIQKEEKFVDILICGGKMFSIYHKGRWENDAGNCNTWALYSGTA